MKNHGLSIASYFKRILYSSVPFLILVFIWCNEIYEVFRVAVFVLPFYQDSYDFIVGETSKSAYAL